MIRRAAGRVTLGPAASSISQGLEAVLGTLEDWRRLAISAPSDDCRVHEQLVLCAGLA
jgi:hypothetical protein